MKVSDQCSLCSLKVTSHHYTYDDHLFCCRGCMLVYQVLSERSSLENYEKDPIFIAATQTGLISNPELIKKFHESKSNDVSKIYFMIDNLWCPSCAQLINLFIETVNGVIKVYVDYATDIGFIEYDPKKTSKEALFQTIREWDYIPKELEPNYNIKNRMKSFKTAVAAFSALNVMMFSLPVYTHTNFGLINYSIFNSLSFFFSLPLLWIWYPYLKRSLKALSFGILSMESLVSISVISALSLSLFHLYQGINHVYFDSMSMLILLVSVGKLLESRAKYNANTSWRTLIQLQPQKVRVERKNQEYEFIPIKDCTAKDRVVVGIGERVPLNATVIGGQASIDLSLLTGESHPQLVEKGDQIKGGALVMQGSLILSLDTDKPSDVQHMIQVIERQFENKVQVRSSLDKLVDYFVPSVLLLTSCSVLYGLYNNWPGQDIYQIALSMLMISCPCSIGLAVPLVKSFFIHDSSREGVIIREPQVIEMLSQETDIVFDKTGTLTSGEYQICEIVGDITMEERGILHQMTSLSTHPAAKAVHQYFQKNSQANFETNLEVIEVLGCGIESILSDSNGRFFLGSGSYVKMILNKNPDNNESNSKVYFFSEDRLIASITLKDSIRDDAESFVKEVIGNTNIHLLSGDQKHPVEAIANELGIQNISSEQSPLNKKEYIDRLKEKNKIVLFMGDGINDALPIIEANIGIAISEGADVSLQVADLVLTDRFFSNLSKLRKRAMKCQRIIKQNLLWSFGYNGIGMILAMKGLLSPLHAVLIMAVSSLYVTFNAIRITKKK